MWWLEYIHVSHMTDHVTGHISHLGAGAASLRPAGIKVMLYGFALGLPFVDLLVNLLLFLLEISSCIPLLHGSIMALRRRHW